MKRLIAFTLAEVLVTLVIIGVITVLTVPALITNIKKQDSYTKLLKASSVIQNTANQIRMENGGKMAGAANSHLALASLFANKMSAVKFCTNTAESPGCYISNSADMYNLQGGFIGNNSPYPYTDRPKIVTGDGLVYIFEIASLSCQDSHVTLNGQPETCGSVFVDINGSKLPNAWGKDIFVVYINDYDVVVAGNARGNSPTGLCNSSSTDPWNGATCAGRVTLEGGIKYY